MIVDVKPCSETHLRHARVGKIKKAAKQRVSVIGADGGGCVGKQVVVKHALPEKLVKKPGGVRRAQGASEPGVLDGDIHNDKFGSTWSAQMSCRGRKGGDVRNLRVGRLRRAFCSPLSHSFYTREPKKRGFSCNPSGMTLSHGGLEPVSRTGAEDEVVGRGSGGVSVRA